uniref:DUF6451 domain-containing protein n=1 Tax=Magallana gigas TaxID=29159 RepID=A0A8W8MZV1_MAGGI
GSNLTNTTSFTYLGSIVTSDGGADKDIKARLSKARGAFMNLENIWKTHDISRKTKLRFYNSCVLSVLLYGAECWRMTEGDINRLSSFHNICLRKIIRIFWPNKISNVELHKKANSEDMRFMLIRRRWQCNTIGNVLRKITDNITRIALQWTPEGKRKPGRPKNTWRRTVEKEMKEHNKALYHPFIANYHTHKKITVFAS